jgi:hypothetical protein
MFFKLCFAYKASSPIQQIGFTVFIDGDSSIKRNAYLNIKTIADGQWHYICVDMYKGLLKSWSTSENSYPTYRLTLIGVIFAYKFFFNIILKKTHFRLGFIQ